MNSALWRSRAELAVQWGHWLSTPPCSMLLGLTTWGAAVLWEPLNTVEAPQALCFNPVELLYHVPVSTVNLCKETPLLLEVSWASHQWGREREPSALPFPCVCLSSRRAKGAQCDSPKQPPGSSSSILAVVQHPQDSKGDFLPRVGGRRGGYHWENRGLTVTLGQVIHYL